MAKETVTWTDANGVMSLPPFAGHVGCGVRRQGLAT
jgi:hypothetical protein